MNDEQPNQIVSVGPEHALVQVVPVCRRCSAQVLFLRPADYVGQLVPVECGCGWVGVSARVMEPR